MIYFQKLSHCQQEAKMTFWKDKMKSGNTRTLKNQLLIANCYTGGDKARLKAIATSIREIKHRKYSQTQEGFDSFFSLAMVKNNEN